MPNIEISVSPELKKRMEQVQPAIDWPAIAIQAFESKLSDTVFHQFLIARLRASERAADFAIHEAGCAAGRRWARYSASYYELSLLNDFHADSDAWSETFSESGKPPHFVSHDIFYVVNPTDDRNPGAPQDFWDKAVGWDSASRANVGETEFIRGFCEGALEVFAEVADQV